MARPRATVDLKQIDALASIQCTLPEMAAVLGCSKRTLLRRFKKQIAAGRKKGRASVRRAQWKLLQAGNATMAIWLGKQLLGQRDYREPPEKPPDNEEIRVRAVIRKMIQEADKNADPQPS
jgi:hypothetical protein